MRIVLFGIAAVSLIFGSCAATIFARVEDSSLSPDKMAEVNFLVRVDVFNGKNVYDNWYKDGEKTADAVNVKIPAGNIDMSTTISVTLRKGTETLYYTVPNVLFSCSFEPGKKYTVVSWKTPKAPKAGKKMFARKEYIMRMRVYAGIHEKIDTKKNKRNLIAEVFLFDTEEVCK